MSSRLPSFFRPRSRRPATAARPERKVRLHLEELETRALLSASGLNAFVAQPSFSVTPLGPYGTAPYSPDQIQKAYGFNKLSLDGTGQTIAIVDAYDNPNILSDLQKFDQQFGLSDPPSLTVATPGGQPSTDTGWALEEALDVEWAHAIAPGADILLVEAASSSGADLLSAIDYARNQSGVSVISMSWGGSEFWNEANYDSYFTTPDGHQGITFVAASGDSGAWYGPDWPSVSPNVLAVGGTRLTLTTQNAWSSETGWSYSTGGYSYYETQPDYQKQVTTNQYDARTTPDVAYNASSATGFYVYDSTNGGWYSVGGTSAGAPQWAALLALTDQALANAGNDTLANGQAAIYGLSSSDFHDITSGSNGYRAGVGYDLVTGRGSPFADKIVKDLLSANGVTLSSTGGGGTGSPSGGGPASTTPVSSNPFSGVDSVIVLQSSAAQQSFALPTFARAQDAIFSTPAGTAALNTLRMPSIFSNSLTSAVGGAAQTDQGMDDAQDDWLDLPAPPDVKTDAQPDKD
jgi:hypothetical protein